MKKTTMTIDPYGDIKVETRGVNSKLLTDEVITFMSETLNNTFFHDFAEEHDRDVVVEYLEHFYHVMLEQDLIEQFDIIFDKRNNTRSDMFNGLYELETKFKQRNCLNATSVTFKFGGKK